MRWLNLVMPAAYIAVGVLLLFARMENQRMEAVRVPLAALLIAYGAFRFWRNHSKSKAEE